MHIVSDIRNYEKFLKHFPWIENDDIPEKERAGRYATLRLRANHYDLVIAKVVKLGATATEDRNGRERQLLLGDWLIAPLAGRESSYSHSSLIPKEGIAVSSTIDYICRGGGLGICPDIPPHKGAPTKVQIAGILQYEDGRVAKSLDFAVDLPSTDTLAPIIAVLGSKSDCGKTTASFEIIKNLRDSGKKIGVAKLCGTARKGELLELAEHANEAHDFADFGLPTTYPPSQEDDERALFTTHQVRLAAEKNVRALSVENDIIVLEFGGDLLSAGVPELLKDPEKLNVAAVVFVAESAMAVIGMETKLLRISTSFKSIPQYVVGPTANLRANRNRVGRETDCQGCYDLWNKNDKDAPQAQRDTSVAHTKALTANLLTHCET